MNQIESLEKLINYFSDLPGVGAKTAQRYAYFILNQSNEFVKDFASALIDANLNIHYCKNCGNFTDKEVCDICSKRDNKIICVVKEPKDILAIEKVKEFKGQYHVLHGTLSPLDNRGPDDIRIKELLQRVQNGGVEEVIMATNPDVEGEATAMYISKLLKPLGIKITRLSQGVSMGSDIEYADEVTLARALEDRKEI